MTQTKTTRECSCGCRKCRVVHLIIWLSIFVRVRIFWISNIFVIIVFPYTHDTGAVTGTEPGDEYARKIIHNGCFVQTESPLTQDSCSASFGKPRTKIWYLSVSALSLHMKICNVLFSFILFYFIFFRIGTDVYQNVQKAERVRFTCF